MFTRSLHVNTVSSVAVVFWISGHAKKCKDCLAVDADKIILVSKKQFATKFLEKGKHIYNKGKIREHTRDVVPAKQHKIKLFEYNIQLFREMQY